MRKLVQFFVTIAAIMVMAAACFADLFDEGKALHKDGRFAEAAVKLEQAAQQNPSDARVWWQLNFTYHQLNRDGDALKAVEKAGQLDSTHAFASQPGKFEKTLADRQKDAGTTGAAAPAQNPPGPPARAGSTTAGSGAGNLAQQLMGGDVYVEPGMNVDAGRLRQVAQELRPTVVKFAVFNSNANSRTLDREAERIRTSLKSYINQGQGYVIAGSRRAVAVSSTSLSDRDKKDLLSQVAPLMSAGRYTEGMEKLARGLVNERAPRAASTPLGRSDIPIVHHGPNWFLIILVGVGGAVVIWLVVKSARAKNEIAKSRGPLERQKSGIISGMNYLEENAAALDAGSAARVNEARISAGTKLDEAARLMSRLSSTADVNRSQSLLDQAEADVQRGRATIERALHGGAAVGAAAGAAGGAPPVYADATSSTTDWNRVPDDEKGVCFFCSRPLLLRELTPVTVNLDGKQQKVLACPDDLATVKSGRVPQIRAFQQNGQYVPWYAYQGYDPYRDYYGRGYGTGDFMRDMVTMSLIDHMFWGWHRPMGWGWGGGYGHSYAFYPDHDYYRDYYSGQAAGHGDYSDIDRTNDASGVDFLSPTGGDSGDFGGSSIGGDFGSDRS